jgi:hypothetical protein
MTISHNTRVHDSRALSAAPRTPRRVLGGLAGAAVCALALTASAGAASAAPLYTDVYSFTAHVYLTNPQGPTSAFVLVSDTCTVRSDGGPPARCLIAGPGVLDAAGGTARPVLTARDHTTILNETFAFTGPTTSTGSGTATVFGPVGVSPGTFTGNFVAGASGNPHVLLDQGTITVTY